MMNMSQLPLLIYAAVFVGIASIAYLLCPKNVDEAKAIISRQKGRKSGLLLLISPLLVGIGEIIKKMPGKLIQKFLQKIQKNLVTAEWDAKFFPEEFAALQIVTPLFLFPFLILSIVKISAFASLRQPGSMALAFAGLFFIGWLIPLLILQDTIKKKQKAISREIPFALDMLTSAVQAGLDFSGAIRRFIQKSTKVTPLKSEMALMLKEISLGKTRSDALRRMAERVALKELTSVVNALIQADQLGTSLAAVLTTLSDDLRVKRFQMAEKMALEAPVKMLFPLIGFIFPAVFIILIGPLILQMISELGKQ